jgi:hypothetical protein
MHHSQEAVMGPYFLARRDIHEKSGANVSVLAALKSQPDLGTRSISLKGRGTNAQAGRIPSLAHGCLDVFAE